MDPRVNVIHRRLENVKNVIAISGGKGGIGKSSCSVIMALTLSNMGYKVGLVDLDFWGPSAHILLGARITGFPKENKGIVPPRVAGIKFMSIIYYTQNKTLALRRSGFEQAVVELLAVTQWGPLDYLIMDMPPGVGDVSLDVIRYIKKIKFCIIMTHSRVVIETVKKTIDILKKLNVPIVGVIQNMKETRWSVKKQILSLKVPFWGEIKFDPRWEGAVSDPSKLLSTPFAQDMSKALHNYLKEK